MPTLTVHLERKTIGDRVVFTSPDVPGLFTTHKDPEVARAHVEDSIRALRRARKQDDIVDIVIVDDMDVKPICVFG